MRYLCAVRSAYDLGLKIDAVKDLEQYIDAFLELSDKLKWSRSNDVDDGLTAIPMQQAVTMQGMAAALPIMNDEQKEKARENIANLLQGVLSAQKSESESTCPMTFMFGGKRSIFY